MGWRAMIVAAVAVLALVAPAAAQAPADPVAPPTLEELANPFAVVEGAAESIPGFEGGLSGAMNVLVLLTVLALVPTIMITMTCYVRFIIVLGLLKQALGANGLPPAQLITALALFMTLIVMTPTLERIHAEAIVPYQNGEIQNQLEMWNRAKQPMRDFMFDQIDAAENWSTIYTILNYRGVDTSEPESLTRADVDMITLIPAYVLSELKVAFLMGFRVYLPFLIIDMVIASVLISMSMMMLPPVLISLPFKILLFMLVDGWTLVVGSLMESVVVSPG
jgi:flagellar biosynthetic protein FliP